MRSLQLHSSQTTEVMALLIQIFSDINLSRLSVVLILLISLVTTQCKNNPVSPDVENFEIEYWFINQGDSDIMAVEILAITHYPKSDSTILQEVNFQEPGPFDTLKTTAPRIGYIGIVTNLGAQIIKHWDDTKEPCWRSFAFSQLDTVFTSQDRIRKFHWPADTVIAKEFYQDRAGFCKPE